ncbi:MAG TPA: type IV pilus twitching motility protein PilT [Mesotoga sp.]|nr:type IV pilus twitching motility protein PilT [Mesotoga sp.]MDD4041742.1 type IV pilus twitching motility protein PilT [Mesotoga sp.]HPB62824.1 type IV pilus twitching motility protein PilT [Mesotoga sp.]HPI17557.1 type IV pilus twitching motility protein PilT [Mesotoga sp.]HQQ55594.1 type IV pilus twitching motility protein PilT [Mesotoga sp.]
MLIEELLGKGEKMNASDVHITCRGNVMYRVDGELVQDVFLTDDIMMRKILSELQGLTNEKFEESGKKEIDFSFGFGSSRVRGNFFYSNKLPALALRLIPKTIRTLDDLGYPELFKEFCKPDKGLVLVAGPTGSGKSTTLAAMLENVNRTRHVHLITIEDPVEYVFEQKNALIHQRELGPDTQSFYNGLKYALRQDPDVILVGEMRDSETMELAMTAAETGHLVFSTIHTNSAATTPERIVGVFPPHQQNQISMQLANTLMAVVYQRLLKRRDGKGRVAVIEIMVVNQAIRNLIREQKFHQIESMMQAGVKFGMVTFDDALVEIFKKGIIDKDQLLSYARDAGSIARRSF